MIGKVGNVSFGSVYVTAKHREPKTTENKEQFSSDLGSSGDEFVTPAPKLNIILQMIRERMPSAHIEFTEDFDKSISSAEISAPKTFTTEQRDAFDAIVVEALEEGGFRPTLRENVDHIARTLNLGSVRNILDRLTRNISDS